MRWKILGQVCKALLWLVAVAGLTFCFVGIVAVVWKVNELAWRFWRGLLW
jgi:hypothetical protein